MTTRPSPARRAATVARWPVGMALTSWRYLWRVTPLHRTDDVVEKPHDEDIEPELDEHLDDERLQRLRDGVGPMFHRRYEVSVEDPSLTAQELIAHLVEDPNDPAPVEVAVFWKTEGRDGPMQPGDEFIVRMPGPWDGPVRVVDRTPTSFRLATMTGHLEAGQIEFRATDDDDGRLRFTIESWTTSGDKISELLYSRVRLIKEMQLHMWTHYCEHVAKVARGRLVDGVHITTRRVDALAR